MNCFRSKNQQEIQTTKLVRILNHKIYIQKKNPKNIIIHQKKN